MGNVITNMVVKEYDDYYQKLLKMKKEEIINHQCEKILFFQNIKMMMESNYGSLSFYFTKKDEEKLNSVKGCFLEYLWSVFLSYNHFDYTDWNKLIKFVQNRTNEFLAIPTENIEDLLQG